MTAGAGQAFFLPVQQGQRFCIYHPPTLKPSRSDSIPPTGSILHIHAFAEEMNKCRRMAALTANTLAAQGMGVLQMDLYGCGDSSADFADAQWHIWKSDILAALDWLKQKHAGTLNLWADRLGALLALDFIRTDDAKIDQLLLCQPVFDGADYLNQLSRIQLARTMLNPNGNGAGAQTQHEIAGYELSPNLIDSIEQLQPASWTVPVRKINWLEMTRHEPSVLAQKRQLFLESWQRIGNPVQLQLITGPAYWQTPEISVSSAWTAACSAPFEDQQ